MTRLLALVVLLLASLLAVNAQSRATNQSPGSPFDEIVVVSDLNVKRKSKESRVGKQLDFTNVQQQQEQRETTATGPTGKQPRARLDFGDGGGPIRSERRKKRGYQQQQQQQQPPTAANFESRKRLKTMKKGKERSLKDKQKPR